MAFTCFGDGGTATIQVSDAGSGSVSVPACYDVNGNHLNYDAGFYCGTSGGVGGAWTTALDCDLTAESNQTLVATPHILFAERHDEAGLCRRRNGYGHRQWIWS